MTRFRRTFSSRRAVQFAAMAILCHSVPIPAAHAADSSVESAPPTRLLAREGLDERDQPATLLFSSWPDEQVDRTRPPISWPTPLVIESSARLSIRISSDTAPYWVQVKAWQKLRRNGIPRGKPRVVECGSPTASGTDETCQMIPVPTLSGVAYEISFDEICAGRHCYVVTFAAWEDGEASWLNHLRVE